MKNTYTTFAGNYCNIKIIILIIINNFIYCIDLPKIHIIIILLLASVQLISVEGRQFIDEPNLQLMKVGIFGKVTF